MSIEFTKNHDDLSTEKGFQFKFYCDKCHNGFLSEYITNKLGVAGSILNAAGAHRLTLKSQRLLFHGPVDFHS